MFPNISTVVRRWQLASLCTYTQDLGICTRCCVYNIRDYLLRSIVISPAPACSTQLLYTQLQSVTSYLLTCISHPASHHFSHRVFTVFPIQLHSTTGNAKWTFPLNNESPHMGLFVIQPKTATLSFPFNIKSNVNFGMLS